MKTLIACCGIDCAGCDARTATITNDNELRAKTAASWRELYQNEAITTESINCMGCRADGVKFAHCNECEIRNCAKSKGYETCGDCTQLESCPTVGFILQIVPDAKANLQSVSNI